MDVSRLDTHNMGGRVSGLRSVGAEWRRGLTLRSYNYSAPTSENYQQVAGSSASHGRFTAIRDSLDVTYHGVYTQSRQVFQDRLVSRLLNTCTCPKQAHPWIVFTAGAMGAGKSRTIEWLSERGIFPLDNIVQIDPDKIKTSLPEWPGYVARDRLTAGYHTHHESGYVVEIAQEAALLAGKHCWVDGSLRDGAWYEQVLRTIKQRHPRYRVAILHVEATQEVILERVRRRGAVTGREVPEHEVLDSIERVPQAVNHLAPLADFLAVIDNSAAAPHLVKYCDADTCFLSKADCWSQIETRFRSVPRPPSFIEPTPPCELEVGVQGALKRLWRHVSPAAHVAVSCGEPLAPSPTSPASPVKACTGDTPVVRVNGISKL